MPNAVKIEESILSACILFDEQADEAVSLLDPSDFYKPRHRKVFGVISDLHEQGKPIDQANIEEQVGDEVFFDMRSTSSDIEKDAETLRNYKRLRDIIEACQQAEHQAYNKQNPNDVLAGLNRLFEQSSSKDITSLSEALTSAVDRNLRVADGEMTLGMKAGLDIDDKIGGYEDGKLYIIAARPAMGKTAYALHIMRKIASNGIPVGMMSLEMTGMSLANRILISAMGINGMDIREGNITEEQKRQMNEVAGEISNLPIFFDDNPVVNAGTLRAKANIMRRRYGIGLLVIDYLQLMSGNGSHGTREQEIAEISRTTKLIAKEHNIPVIALSQLSRKVEHRDVKRPQLSDLRESGAIEQDADCVQFLYRPSEYGRERYPDSDVFSGTTENICEIIVGKNREGQTGISQQLFIPSKMKFGNLEQKYDDIF